MTQVWLETSRQTITAFAAVGLWLLAVGYLLRLLLRSGKGSRRRIRLFLHALLATGVVILFLAPSICRFSQRRADVLLLRDDSASVYRSSDNSVATLESAIRQRTDDVVETFNKAKVHVQTIPFSELSNTLKDARVLLLTDGLSLPENVESRLSDAMTVDSVLFGDSSAIWNWRLENPRFETSKPDAGSTTLDVDVILQSAAEDHSRRAILDLWRVASDAEIVLVGSESAQLPPDVERLAFSHRWETSAAPDDTFLLLIHDATSSPSTPQERYESLAKRLASSTSPVASKSEANLADNGLLMKLGGRKRRVLLVDDLPRYDYRYLRETLRREDDVELRTILYSADPRIFEADPSMLNPMTLDRRTLASFDLVFLGDLTQEQLDGKLARLVEVVQRDSSTTSVCFLGTSCAASSSFSKLLPGRILQGSSPLVPEEDSDEPNSFNVQIERVGNAVWPDLSDASLPEFDSAPIPFEPQHGATTLLSIAPHSDESSSSESPLLVVAGLGTTSVGWFGGDELWRLQTTDDKNLLRKFLLQMIDYLVDGNRTQQRNVALNDEEPFVDLAVQNLNHRQSSFLVDFFQDHNPRRLALLREYEDAPHKAESSLLDLRDVDSDSIDAKLDQFLDAKIQALPVTRKVEQTQLVNVNIVIPLLLTLLLLIFLV